MVIIDESHFKLAKNFGIQNSPCVRRKYGTIIINELGNFVLGANKRIGKCCTAYECARDRLITTPGHPNVEIGAEIHAEQAALIDWNHQVYGGETQILLAGVDRYGKDLFREEAYPCHVCALMIKYAGFNYVWLNMGDPLIRRIHLQAVSISEVIEHYESLY